MIQCKNVSKTYANGYTALSDVSFEIVPGEFVFLTGPSGAGKSTLLKLIAGLEPASAGKLIVNERDLSQTKEREKLRADIGFVFQEPHLIDDHTVAENLALPLIIKGLDEEAIQKRIRAVLDKVHLVNKENCFPSELSTGELQRVGLARATINTPRLLLADEPTGNLDEALARNMIELFQFFNESGTTVLIATHDTQLIDPRAKRLHLDKGVLS